MQEVRYQDYFGNDDATPERVKKAKEAGLSTDVVDIYLPSGMPSGARRRQIESPLATALRHRWINEEQKQAGEQFFLHMVLSRSQIKFTTSSWQMPIDNSPHLANPFEKRRFHEHELRRALHTLHWKLRQPFIDWMSESAHDDTNITRFGAKFTKAKHRDPQREVGIWVLNFILDDLGQHFGYINRRNSWDTRHQLEELLSKNRGQEF